MGFINQLITGGHHIVTVKGVVIHNCYKSHNFLVITVELYCNSLIMVITSHYNCYSLTLSYITVRWAIPVELSHELRQALPHIRQQSQRSSGSVGRRRTRPILQGSQRDVTGHLRNRRDWDGPRPVVVVGGGGGGGGGGGVVGQNIVNLRRRGRNIIYSWWSVLMSA